MLSSSLINASKNLQHGKIPLNLLWYYIKRQTLTYLIVILSFIEVIGWMRERKPSQQNSGDCGLGNLLFMSKCSSCGGM